MAIEKPMNSRVLLKNDIEANWMKAVNFIPKLGEAIIYNAEVDNVTTLPQDPETKQTLRDYWINYPRIKIGDGTTNVNDLPFITDAMEGLELAIDGKADAEHTHTMESIDGLQEAVNAAADSKFYVVTFDMGSDGEYHGDLTFAEIREKFEAGGNMVARIDGTDYIPLLSAAPHQIIFSGIYQSQSVALTITANDVCTLTTTSLSRSNHNHPTASSSTSGFMSKEDKSKLNGIETGAEVNVIESIVVNGEEVTVTDKTVNITIPEQTQVQTDWNQNDEAALDYIKNRPFYEESNAWVTLLSSTAYSPFTFSSTYNAYVHETLAAYELTIGKKYRVTWDGTEYECTAQDASQVMSGAIVLGNASAFGLDGNDEPFALATRNGYVAYMSNTDDDHTVAIEELGTIIHKIDSKYLSDDIAFKEDIPEVPVTSVNGMTGDVVINMPEIPVTSVNGMTGDVIISISDGPIVASNNIYVQEEEPLEAPDGSLWVDLDEEIEDTSIEVDASLSIEGAAADAKVVGDRLASIEEELDKPQIAIDTTLSQPGAAADAKAVGDALATKQPLGNYVKAVNGNTPDENGNVVVEFEGVTSWNDLTDKPFQYETVYYEWDEDTEYETIVPVGTEGDNVIVSSYAKISDDVPSKDFLIGKYLEITQRSSGETASLQITSNLIEEDEGAYQVALWLVFVTADSYDMGAANPLTRGVWCVHGAEDNPMTLSALSIYDPAVQLDESVIPDTIARVEDIPSTFYVTVVYNPDTNEATSDKAFDEINEAYLSGTTVFVKLKTYNEEHSAALVLPLTNYQEDFIDFNCIIEGNKVYTVSFSPTEGVHASVNEISSGGGSEFNGDADTLDGKHASEFALATDVEELRELIENIPAAEQVQADWNQTEETAPDYIKNKPEVVTKEYIDEAVSNIENAVLITVEDIDEICGTAVQFATDGEVAF